MIAKLLFIEWLKARQRIAFWATTLGFVAMLSINLGTAYRAHLARPELRGLNMPASWPTILNQGGEIGSLLLVAALVLLVAAERTWRTQRQNIIDGLSRDQYMVGKILLAALLAVLFWVTVLVVATVFGWLDARIGQGGWTLFAQPLHYRMMGGLLLYFLTVASVGLCFGVISSGAGAGLAFAFLFIIVQQPILFAMALNGGYWARAAAYMPDRVLDSLLNAAAYDPARLAALLERAVLQQLGAGTAALVACAYIVFFTGVAWLATRYRDL